MLQETPLQPVLQAQKDVSESHIPRLALHRSPISSHKSNESLVTFFFVFSPHGVWTYHDLPQFLRKFDSKVLLSAFFCAQY